MLKLNVVLTLISAASIDTLLNNLSEADFDLRHFKVIKTVSSSTSIIKKLKLSSGQISQIVQGLKNNLVLVIGDHYPNSDIVAMFNDYQPQFLLTL